MCATPGLRLGAASLTQLPTMRIRDDDSAGGIPARGHRDRGLTTPADPDASAPAVTHEGRPDRQRGTSRPERIGSNPGPSIGTGGPRVGENGSQRIDDTRVKLRARDPVELSKR